VAIVAAAALAAPLALGLFPRIRLPSIALEIVIGPQVLGWGSIDTPIQVTTLLRSAPTTRAPAGVPAADVLPRDTELVADLGLRAAGGEQLAGLETDTFKGLAVAQTAGVAAVGGWSHAAMLPGQPRSCHRKDRTSFSCFAQASPAQLCITPKGGHH
jgi:hypothetical protein